MNLIKLYKESFEGLSREVWILALIYLINRCGEMVIPFMSVFLTSQLGYSKTQSAIVLTCFGVGALMGSTLGGQLTDRIGNFKVMAISLAGAGVAFIGIIFFKDFYYLSSWMIVAGIFNSMFSPAAFSAITKWGKKGNETRGYSLLRMAINMGIAIGPSVGGFMAFKFGYSWLFVLDGITCFVALIFLFILLKHKDEKFTSVKQDKLSTEGSPYRDKYLILFLFFNLINMVAFFQILFTIPVYFNEVLGLNEKLIGYFFTVNGLLIIILEMPVVYVIEKKKRYFKMLALGAILIGLGFLSINIFTIPLMAIAAYSLLIAIGEVINFPFIPTLAMMRSSEHNQGKYMGMVSMMFAMAFSFAPMSGLAIVDRIGFHDYFYLAAAMCAVSGICVFFLKPYFKV